MKKNVLAYVLVALSAMSMSGCGAAKNYAANNTEFVIGGSGPLTGGAAVYGTGVRNSAQMAVDEINAAGGFKGYQFKLNFLDDAHNAEKASANYDALYEGGMQVSLGCVTSAPCKEFATKAQEDGVFSLTPSATADTVPASGDCIYQMCFSDSGQGSASSSFIKGNAEWAGKSVGVLYEKDVAYSKGIYDNFVAAYGTPAVVQTFTSDAADDLSVQANALKDCDIIFLPIYYSEASTFIEQAKNLVKANAVYFGCDGLDGIDAVEGFDVYSYTQEISYLSHFNANDSSEKVQAFVTKYSTTYGTSDLTQFGASAYDCVYAIYAAMQAYDGTLTPTTSPQDFAKAMKSVFQSSSFTFNGVTGSNMKWNADGTVAKTAGKYVVNQKTN